MTATRSLPMRLARVLLLVLICLETGGIAATAWQRWQSTRPPLPDLAGLDPLSREEILDTHRRLDPHSGADWLQLAMLYNLHGYFPEAEICAGVACDNRPDEALAWFERGLALHQTGRMEEAIRMFERAIPLADRSLAAMCAFAIGRNHLRLEQPEAAEAAFQRAGPVPAAQFELARLHIRSGRYDAAERIVAALIASDPAEQEYHQLELRLAEARGDEPRARLAEFRSEWATDRRATDAIIALFSSRLREHGLEARFSTSLALSRRNRPDEAARLAAEVLAAEWQPRFSAELVQLELKLGHLDNASRLVQDQVERDGPTEWTERTRGEIAWLRNDSSQAREHWLRAVRLDPFGLAAKRLIETGLSESDPATTSRLTQVATLSAARRSLLNRQWSRAQQELERFDPTEADQSSLETADYYAGVAAFQQHKLDAAREHWNATAGPTVPRDRLRRARQLVAETLVKTPSRRNPQK